MRFSVLYQFQVYDRVHGKTLTQNVSLGPCEFAFARQNAIQIVEQTPMLEFCLPDPGLDTLLPTSKNTLELQERIYLVMSL